MKDMLTPLSDLLLRLEHVRHSASNDMVTITIQDTGFFVRKPCHCHFPEGRTDLATGAIR